VRLTNESGATEGEWVARVHIENLAEGMVLKCDVCDRSGRMLLPEGVALTEKHFKILKMWGVLEVETTDDQDAANNEPRESAEVDPARLALALDRVQHLFVHNDSEHPAIKELTRICANREASHAP
jgi:hypothetical protein